MAKKKNVPVEDVENKSPDKAEGEKKAPTDASKYAYVIKNKKARALTKHKKAIVIAGIALLLVLLLVGAFYGFYTAVDVNNFRIFVDSSGSRVLSLSANREMQPSSELIELIGPANMTNTTLASGKNIASSFSIEDKLEEILAAEGSATTIDDYFIAGTFYVKNVTNESKQYVERITFEQAEKGTAKALRVMLIKNDEISVYAHPCTDEKGKLVLDENGEIVLEEVVPLPATSTGYPYTERTIHTEEDGTVTVSIANDGKPWMTKPFYNDNGNYEHYALLSEENTIESGEIIRYSIVIWFEGWDKQCVDDILDGEVKMTLSFACLE